MTWKSLSTAGILITNTDLPAETIYMIAKTILDHTKELGEVHKSGYSWNLEGATEAVAIPFHPGAEKCLKEKGKL